jgi:hypothetical protein
MKRSLKIPSFDLQLETALSGMFFSAFGLFNKGTSVSRFQEKEKRGEMITINDNIK